MSDAELKEILDNHLLGTGVCIHDDAIKSIIKLSNNFPQPVHLLGYHAFRIDNDSDISINDVDKAKDYIVQNLKKQEYELKFDKLGTGKRVELLRRVAQSKYVSVSVTYIRHGLPHFSEREIYGIIGELEDKGVLERQHKGSYRFTEPLFKIYLRWLFGIEE
jgi:hypothetical protein